MRARLIVFWAAAAAVGLVAAPGLAAPEAGDWNGRCATRVVGFQSSPGAVLQGPNRPVTNGVLAVGGPAYLARKKVTLDMQDTTFVISPGTYFRPECFGAYGKGPYPSVKLYLGKVRVTGTASSPQQTGVRTWEAMAHTLEPHPVVYTIRRAAKTMADGNAGKGRVTVRTLKGGPIMLSPRQGLQKKWACKNGQTFTVDWQGNVTQH